MYDYSSVTAFNAFPLLIKCVTFEDPLGEILDFKRTEPTAIPALTMPELITYLNNLDTDMTFRHEDNVLFYKSEFPIERTMKINSTIAIEFQRLPLINKS